MKLSRIKIIAANLVIMVTMLSCSFTQTLGQAGSPLETSPASPPAAPVEGAADAESEIPAAEEASSATQAPPDESTREQPEVLNIGIMIHLEGWNDLTEKDVYIRHTDLVREYAALFEKYGAKMTIETIDVARADLKWGGNFISEMSSRGHGIGLHADVGGNPAFQCNQFVPELRQMKRVFDQLGVPIMHTSGVVSKCDWVTASAEAGFDIVTGNVAYALLSLSPEMIPEEYRDCRTPKECHQPWPTELDKQIHPWRAESGSNWIEPNADGPIVILTESGGLTHMAEQLNIPGSNYGEDQFTSADVDAYFTLLEEALQHVDPTLENNFYISWSIGKALDSALIEDWLKRLEPYVASGKVRWMTLPEMYQSYIDWEERQ